MNFGQHQVHSWSHAQPRTGERWVSSLCLGGRGRWPSWWHVSGQLLPEQRVPRTVTCPGHASRPGALSNLHNDRSDLIPNKYVLLFPICIFFFKKASQIVYTRGLLKPDSPLGLGQRGKIFDPGRQLKTWVGLLMAGVTGVPTGLLPWSLKGEHTRFSTAKFRTFLSDLKFPFLGMPGWLSG